MIIYFAQGRLGNQIFQYSYLKKVQQGEELILTFGMDEFVAIFEKQNQHFNIPKNKFTKILLVFKYLFRFVSKIGIFSRRKPKKIEIVRDYKKDSTDIYYSDGLIKNIHFIETSSYESEIFFPDDLRNKLIIKEKYYEKARDFLYKIEEKNRVFIHIRLGDYDNYTVFGKSAKLPISYYKTAIKKMGKIIDNPTYIFLSNSPEKIEQYFNDVELKIVSTNDFGTDLALMTLCEYGITSASTFSFWGAFLMKSRMKVYSPKYWKGFNSKIEYPVSGFPTFAEPVAVEPNRQIL